MLDKIDKELIKEVQIDSNRKTYQLGKKLNIPRTTIHNRIKKLEKQGYIKGYKAIVDANKIGKNLCVLVHIAIGREIGAKEVAEKIKKFPNIEEIYVVSGQFDIIVKLRIKNTEELANLVFSMESGLRKIGGIARTESMIVL
ncbi:MAG: Lrp/AsnC family transcriptional regulator, partial [Nanoarchaeota archaeon]|nr:Lrp/AsnC family transcriptional regulator [Nanoarchaeota archaeon]